MSSDSEVVRLKEVYRDYCERGLSRSQWSDTNLGNQAIGYERNRILHELLRTAGFIPLTQRRVLDVGCGSGKVLGNFLEWGATPQNLYGVDLLADRIQLAKQNHPQFNFQTVNAEELPFQNGNFDLVVLFTVFTSILDEQMAENVAGEIRRVLRSGGAIVWCDFRYNNPRNRNVRGLSRTAISHLFPRFEINLRTATLLPPLARRLGRLTPVIYPLLVRLPFLRTHHIGLLIKP